MLFVPKSTPLSTRSPWCPLQRPLPPLAKAVPLQSPGQQLQSLAEHLLLGRLLLPELERAKPLTPGRHP